jgi:hypothetical protein
MAAAAVVYVRETPPLQVSAHEYVTPLPTADVDDPVSVRV